MCRSYLKQLSVLLAFLVFLSASFAHLAHAQVNGSPHPDKPDPVAFLSGDAGAHEHRHLPERIQDGKFKHGLHHNPADHSHDVSAIADYRDRSSPSLSNKWRSRFAVAQVDYLLFGIERPLRL